MKKHGDLRRLISVANFVQIQKWLMTIGYAELERLTVYHLDDYSRELVLRNLAPEEFIYFYSAPKIVENQFRRILPSERAAIGASLRRFSALSGFP